MYVQKYRNLVVGVSMAIQLLGYLILLLSYKSKLSMGTGLIIFFIVTFIVIRCISNIEAYDMLGKRVSLIDTISYTRNYLLISSAILLLFGFYSVSLGSGKFTLIPLIIPLIVSLIIYLQIEIKKYVVK
jgi:hypothetical protein